VSEPTREENTRAAGDPTPLGLAGLGMTLALLSLHTSGLMKRPELAGVVGAAAVVFGLLAVLLAVYEFRLGDTLVPTLFGATGAFWLIGWWHGAGTPGVVEDSKSAGVYLLAWALLGVFLTVAAAAAGGLLFLVSGGLTLTWLFLGLGQYQHGADPTSLTSVGGWIGLATAALALYAACAGLTSEAHGRDILPTLNR
jgi:succinate-acetate transporter protein